MRRWGSKQVGLLIASSVSVRPRKGATSVNPFIDELFVCCCEVSMQEMVSSVARGSVVGIGMADNDKLFAQVGPVSKMR